MLRSQYITLKRTGWKPVALIPFVESKTFVGVRHMKQESRHCLITIHQCSDKPRVDIIKSTRKPFGPRESLDHRRHQDVAHSTRTGQAQLWYISF